MAEPNPVRHIDAIRGLLPKVFIVYPHNPEVYRWNPVREQEQERRTKEDVRLHDQLVYNFAQYLESLKIAVAYEGLLIDTFTPNYMKWFQDQIADSDYVILIITNSFCHFLSNQPPEGKERIFTGHFLHTFVNNPKKPILPVFLNRQKELDLLPDALRSSTTYVVRASSEPPYFDVNQRELDSLYALLTKQNRVVPPPTVSAVPVIGNSLLQRRQRGGTTAPVNSSSQFSERHRRMYEALSGMHRRLERREINILSEKPGFASQWSMLANYFHFTPAEIERIMYGDHDDAERCFNCLSQWAQKEYSNATVSRLIAGVYSTGSTVMLEVASDVLMPS